MEKRECIFVDGMRFETPNEVVREKAPWIKGKISIEVEKLIPFIQKYQNARGWVNIDLKMSKGNKLYLELNSYEVKALKKEEPKVEEGEFNANDIPFK